MFGWRTGIAAFGCLIAAPAFAGCTAKAASPVDLGTYSPGAVRQTVVPYISVSSGFGCSAAILSLLSSDYARATVSSTQNFTLTSTDTANKKTVSYTLAADVNGANPIVSGSAFTYKGPGVNLLGLLGDVSDVKIFVRPTSLETVPAGTYTGQFKIDWAWKFCTGLGVSVLGVDVCALGAYDTNTGPPAVNATTTVTVTLVVEAKPVDMTVATKTTWDPQSNTTNPRATPGSRQRTTITVSNLDIATIDPNSLKIILPTPNKGVVALDGDKTAGNPVVVISGVAASKLNLTYLASNSAGDDVDFSNNANFRADTEPWSYQPTPGDAAMQAAITAVRFRPQGTMAAKSSFSMSLPYSVF